MEKNDEAAKANAEARAREARLHRIFGVIAVIVITALIAVMFVIDEVGESRMPNAPLKQPHDSADDH